MGRQWDHLIAHCVKGTLRNDKAVKEKFSELHVLPFPDEMLQSFVGVWKKFQG